MNKTRTHTRLNNKIVELARSKTKGELIDIVSQTICRIELLSFPAEKIISMIVTDFGVMLKLYPSSKSITLKDLSIDDKLEIISKINEPSRKKKIAGRL